MQELLADALPKQYRIERKLGAGGMGTVYLARDLRHDRPVAIKVLREHVAPAARPERFLREIRIAAQLTHPHILPVIDSGESAGILFYVMPYIDGETLRVRLARAGEFPISEAIRILGQLLDGLSYAHGRGMVHRDIKPENILLTDRNAVIADFGIAKALSDPSAPARGVNLTFAGMAIGTPAYMAPEQIGGGAVDHRADIYSTGLVGYEMLAGRLPFDAENSQQVMTAHLTIAPTAIAMIRPAIPPRLADAVMKCLEKRPGDRWQNAANLLAELEMATVEERTTGSEISNEIVERQFALSERVCRKLNRTTLDPRIIGDHLSYADNQVSSDVLVFFLHGLGLDHHDFEPILKRLPCRGLSPTLYGGEPDRHSRISLSLADHVVILREWLREVVEKLSPSIVVMVGFSLGVDMGFEILLTPSEEPKLPVDAFLCLEGNLCLGTCFVSRVLAGLSPDRPDALLSELRQFGSSAASLDEWLNIQEYLVKVLRKFQADIGVLQRAAADIVRTFSEGPEFEIFARWFKGARERIPALRLIFSNDSGSQAALARLRLENLDKRILGEEFPDRDIFLHLEADHFQLMAPDHVLRHINELVASVRRTRRRVSIIQTA